MIKFLFNRSWVLMFLGTVSVFLVQAAPSLAQTADVLSDAQAANPAVPTNNGNGTVQITINNSTQPATLTVGDTLNGAVTNNGTTSATFSLGFSPAAASSEISISPSSFTVLPNASASFTVTGLTPSSSPGDISLGVQPGIGAPSAAPLIITGFAVEAASVVMVPGVDRYYLDADGFFGPDQSSTVTLNGKLTITPIGADVPKGYTMGIVQYGGTRTNTFAITSPVTYTNTVPCQAPTTITSMCTIGPAYDAPNENTIYATAPVALGPGGCSYPDTVSSTVNKKIYVDAQNQAEGQIRYLSVSTAEIVSNNNGFSDFLAVFDPVSNKTSFVASCGWTIDATLTDPGKALTDQKVIQPPAPVFPVTTCNEDLHNPANTTTTFSPRTTYCGPD